MDLNMQPQGLRVALVFGTFPPSTDGGADFVYNLARRLAEQGVQVHVITSTQWKDFDSSRMPALFHYWPVIEDWGSSSPRSPSGMRLLQTLSQVRPHVVHMVYPASRLAPDEYQLPLLAMGAGPWAVVVTFFSMYLLRGVTWRTRWQSLRLIMQSDAVTTHDAFYLRLLHLVRLRLRPRAYFVPVGANLDVGAQRYDPGRLEQRQRAAGLAQAAYVAHFGQVDASRAVHVLLEAAAILRREGLDVRVLMLGAARPQCPVGTGPHERARRRVLLAEKGLDPEAVIWKGYLPNDQVVAHMLASHCTVLPFVQNTLGRSSLALALSLGMPTITSGHKRSVFLEDHGNCLLVPPRDAPATANAIKEVLSRQGLAQRLSEGARAAAQWYSWDTVLARMLYVYGSAPPARA